MRNWRPLNLTSASALEECHGDLWWYDTPSSIGTGEVHVSRLLRCCDWGWRQRFCWPRRDVIFKLNLHTPRCTCEGHVSRDWYGEHVWSVHGEMRCRILRRLQDEPFCTAVLILFSPRCSCEGNVSRIWYGDTSLHLRRKRVA